MEWAPRQAKPTIDIISLSRHRMEFLLANSDVGTANAIRRIILSEIPSLAIEVVTVLENTSVMHDEYIAHRLGLLPIDSSLAHEYEYRDRCQCSDKCSRCTVDYVLESKCTDDSKVVTHFDIVPEMGGSGRGDSSIPMPVPRQDFSNFAGSTEGIPIVKLKRGQSLHMKLTATKGLGKFHAKWIVANVGYSTEPRFTFNHAAFEHLSTDNKAQLAASCPRGVYQYFGGAQMAPQKLWGTVDFKVVNKTNCIYCDECINFARELGHRDLIKIEPDETRFRFSIESTGAIPPEKILEVALLVLEEKMTILHSSFTEAQARALGTSTTFRGDSRAPHGSSTMLDLD
ncbi:bifunctional DNA-directed RNA polymerase [Babesia duncani]|uniref:Bifunctional DNA-directed RNA polymerase n=1 Tax=Babesia duncani TaxID=323732 RepID=A0AAD9UMI0_9APIC|nr:bifunctional DNA-directed RNA polymerase [Babesia duncani]KAK2197552.1 bifunctional DNA-directed RNA polymerase [Babesia duncani]